MTHVQQDQLWHATSVPDMACNTFGLLCDAESADNEAAPVDTGSLDASQSGFYVYGGNTSTELVIDSGSEEVAVSAVFFPFDCCPTIPHHIVDYTSRPSLACIQSCLHVASCFACFSNVCETALTNAKRADLACYVMLHVLGARLCTQKQHQS